MTLLRRPWRVLQAPCSQRLGYAYEQALRVFVRLCRWPSYYCCLALVFDSDSWHRASSSSSMVPMRTLPEGSRRFARHTSTSELKFAASDTCFSSLCPVSLIPDATRNDCDHPLQRGRAQRRMQSLRQLSSHLLLAPRVSLDASRLLRSS